MNEIIINFPAWADLPMWVKIFVVVFLIGWLGGFVGLSWRK